MRKDLRGTGLYVSLVCRGFVGEADMFAASGKRVPGLRGESKPQAATEPVVLAIREHRGEVVGSARSNMVFGVLNAVTLRRLTSFPRNFGVVGFYREQAPEN